MIECWQCKECHKTWECQAFFSVGHWGMKAALYHSKYKGFRLYREVDTYNVCYAHSWFGVLEGRDEPLHASTRDALKGMINEFWGKLA